MSKMFVLTSLLQGAGRGEHGSVRFGDLEISGTEPVFGDLVFSRTGTDPNLRNLRIFGSVRVIGDLGRFNLVRFWRYFPIKFNLNTINIQFFIP